MLGPFCETEVYAPVVRDLGLKSIELWRETFPGTGLEGTLVVAGARDKSEVEHFARLTEGHERVDGDAIARLEPDLEGRFGAGLFYAQEAHVAPRAAMEFLLEEASARGVQRSPLARTGTEPAARRRDDHRLPRPRRTRKRSPICAACAASG